MNKNNINLILAILFLCVAVITFFEKRSSINNIEYIILIYLSGSVIFLGRYFYLKRRNKNEKN